MQPLRPHLKTTRQKLSQEDPWVIQMHMKLALTNSLIHGTDPY